jgi:hypothetical protein
LKLAEKAVKGGVFGAKKGENSLFEVTIWLIGNIYKRFISYELREINGSKTGLHRVGGWGQGDFRGFGW